MKERDVLSSIKEYQPGPTASDCIWSALGLPSCGTKLHELIHQGLPFEHLDQTARLLRMQRGTISKAICVSPTTLARRAKSGRFNSVESDPLISLVAVFEQALFLIEKDASAAAHWMMLPVRGLGSKRPLEMVGIRIESEAVLDLIGRLGMKVLV